MRFKTLKAIKAGIIAQDGKWNHYYLKEIEALGLVPPPENVVELHEENKGSFRSEMRIWSPDEVQKIVQVYLEYAQKKQGETV